MAETPAGGNPCCVSRACGHWKSRRLSELAQATAATRPADWPSPVVDMHAHLFCPESEAVAARAPGYAQQAAEQARLLGPESAQYNRSMFGQLEHRLVQAEARLLDMDAMGVDIQVVSPSPTQYHYWADRELSQDLVALQNQAIARLCTCAPRRLAGLACVSLQHPELAAQQLEDAMQRMGLRGAEISTQVGGMQLSDRSLDVFWSQAERLGAVIFVHPYGCSLGERIAPWYLSNVLGQPAETTVALSHLIFGRVLDRFPALKICAAHGGGYLPGYVERSDHAWHVRPESRSCAAPPSTYLARLHYDTLVYSPAALCALVSQVGASQVLMGTDYPFDMGAYDPWDLVAQLPMSDSARAAIAGGNAVRLFNLQDKKASTT